MILPHPHACAILTSMFNFRDIGLLSGPFMRHTNKMTILQLLHSYQVGLLGEPLILYSRTAALLLLALALAFVWQSANTAEWHQRMQLKPSNRWALTIGILLLIAIVGISPHSQFIYYQF